MLNRQNILVFFLFITLFFLASRASVVYAQVTPSSLQLYDISTEQTISFHFHNASGSTITEFDAYVDQTYVQMGNGSASLGTCGTSTRVDDGNWHFAGCSMAADSTTDGSFPVVAVAGAYTDADLTMNFTYGGDSNTVSVTISGTPSATATVNPNPTSTPTPTSASTTTTTTKTITVTVIITPTPIPSPTPTPTPIPDRSPPDIALLTPFTAAFPVAPTIEGKAADKSGVAGSIEYSLDDGRNWAPVDMVNNPGATNVTFSFTPTGLLDDNYAIRIRASDSKGNAGVSPTMWTMIIDRLPPMIGGTLVTAGPQVINPTPQGDITTVVGMTQTLTVSAVGGPTQIHLLGDLGNLRNLGDLKKNIDTGLWSTVLSFDSPGRYRIFAHAQDGAGNTTDRPLVTMMVLPGGVITDGTHPIRNARVTVYYLDQASKQFIPWDGRSYGQKNPLTTDESGSYTLYLPGGTYYIRIHAAGFRTEVSSIFTLVDGMPITTSFALVPARSWRLGPWTIPFLDFRQTNVDMVIVPPQGAQSASNSYSIVGSELPYFSFPLDTTSITSTRLHGKPTDLVFFNTWDPQYASQLAIVNDLAAKKEIQIVGVVPQETASFVNIFRKRGGYTVPIVADPDGVLIGAIHLQTVPTHVFLKRNGVVASVITGVLTREQILDEFVK